MPGATSNKPLNLSSLRIAVIESNINVSGHACTVFHVMLEDDSNHFSLVRFLPDFKELDEILHKHFPKYRIPLPNLIDHNAPTSLHRTESNMKLRSLFSSMKKKKTNSEMIESYLNRCAARRIGRSSPFRDFLTAQRDEDRVISKTAVRELVVQHNSNVAQNELFSASASPMMTASDAHAALETIAVSNQVPMAISNFSSIHTPINRHESGLDSSSVFGNTDMLYCSSIHFSDDQAVPLTTNETINDFELIKVLGKGATGKVILVREQREQKLFALKTITKSWNITRREVDHIKMERDILASLADIHHPFLVRLHRAFQDAQNLYLVLDYHVGADLATLLQRYVRFPAEQCRLYAAEIVMGLQELHRHHILYRDLKPENVLLASDGHIVLTDFGLSRMFAEEDCDDHRTNTFCGTPEYLAPEIIQDEDYSYAADFWSLGTMLYEMLTGVIPFTAPTLDEMYDRVLHDDLLFPTKFDPEAMDLIAGLLDRNPATRLGAGFGGVFELRNHSYFVNHLNWKDVHAKRTQPVYYPTCKSEVDLSNFDPDFLNMSTQIKEESDEAILSKQKGSPEECPAGLTEDAFKGYSYINVKDNDGIPYESELSFFDSEYMMYDEEDDLDEYYQYDSEDELDNDTYDMTDSSVRTTDFLNQPSSSSSSILQLSSVDNKMLQKKTLRSVNSSIMMNPCNQNIRNSMIIPSSVKGDLSAWRI